jgi:hypothetical protein
MEYYLNFTPDAIWPNRVYHRMEDFFTHCRRMGKRVHPLLLPREDGGLGCHVFIFQRDTLHVLDLGVSQAVSGNVLFLLCHGDYISADAGDACREIFSRISSMYSSERTPSRFSNIELQMFCNIDAPRIQAPWLKGKAAETRHFVPLLREVWERYSKNTGHDQHVSAVLENLTEAYSILGVRADVGRSPLFMSEEASGNFRAVIQILSIHISFLKALSLSQDPPLLTWHMYPKNHALWHVAYESAYGHPSSARTYLNEDYMQHVKLIGMANRYAISASRRSLTIAERVALGRSMELFLKASIC